MRLTLLLMKWGKIPGKITQGKHQLPHYFSPAHREKFVKNLKIEMENEMWLTRPYLTTEQESFLPNGTRFTAPETRWPELDHKVSNEELYEFHNRRYRIRMPPHVTLEDRWGDLDIEDKWEEEIPESKIENRFARYSEMAIPKSLPDRLPRPVEKWDEWNNVPGFSKKPPR